MTVGDVFGFIDSFAPFASQSAWDNSGLLLGEAEREAHKTLVCLDLTKETVQYAVENGCDLIVSHHPVIFRAVKSISSASVFWPLIKNDICVISAHTNLDKAVGGVNDTLCEALFGSFKKCGDEAGDGFLNIGIFNRSMPAEQTAAFLKMRLGGTVRYTDGGKPIKNAAVCAGAGGEFYKEAALLGCDALITGDADHHDFLDAAALHISLFAAGHYETEIPMIGVLTKKLSERFTDASFLQYPGKNTIITY